MIISNKINPINIKFKAISMIQSTVCHSFIKEIIQKYISTKNNNSNTIFAINLQTLF